MIALETAAFGYLDAAPRGRFVGADARQNHGNNATASVSVHRAQSPLRSVTRIRQTATGGPDAVERLVAPGASLADHLSRQVAVTGRSRRELALIHWIVGNLDLDGYLRADLADLGTVVGASLPEVEAALAAVQTLDPIGVGARSVRECLLLQLRAELHPDPLAVRLVDGHLKAVAERRYGELAHILGETRERIMTAVAKIRRLEPRPGRPFGILEIPMIQPDAVIEKDGRSFRVLLREDLTGTYASPAPWRHARADQGGAPGSSSRGPHQGVAWGLTALERRRRTLRALVESIVMRQPGFLAHGPGGLRPLRLRQVAADVGVHDSTISRAVAHRYVSTPHGIFPVRHFFAGRLPRDSSGTISQRAARQRLREIIETEDASSPLTDGGIARALADIG